MAGGITEPEAFHRLQKLAMDKRKSLREVAEAIITAHEAMDRSARTTAGIAKARPDVLS